MQFLRKQRTRALVVAATLLAACAGGGIPLADARLADVLVEADAWTLYALDPDIREEGQTAERDFHGWTILGEATLTDRDLRKKLSSSLSAGIRGNDDSIAACFHPRHGIRAAADGGAVDLVICFQCLQIYVYDGETGEKAETELTTERPRPTFDAVYSAAGLTIAR